MLTLRFSIQRYLPEQDRIPRMQLYELALAQMPRDWMLLDALEHLRQQDPTLAFRSSCKEGVCGSDGMNVNGKNRLSCITRLSTVWDEVKDKDGIIKIHPLPGLPIIRDLVVDMNQFFQHYAAVQPWLIPPAGDRDHELLQTPTQRAELEGLYECILCACCTTSCPAFWWNPDKFHGPAALLAAQRFVSDSRDQHTQTRLQALDDAYGTFRCRNIQNCTANCPKGLDPSGAIRALKRKMLTE